MSWAVVDADEQGIHVMPWDDDADEAACGHRAAVDCPCQPTAKRDAPLDQPILSHHEPTWPGALDPLS